MMSAGRPIEWFLLEAAIGIEPMNKGFAVRSGNLSPSFTQQHSLANVGTLLGNADWVLLNVNL